MSVHSPLEELRSQPKIMRSIEIIDQIKGLTLKESCRKLKVQWPMKRGNKGAGGLIGERILGISNNNFHGPDMRDIGVEVKYLPIYCDKQIPKEPTAITMINFLTLPDEEWESASIRDKIEHVFWVAYGVDRQAEKWDEENYRILGCHLEVMSNEDLEICREDWQRIKDLIVKGEADNLSCSMGRFIEPKTKGKNSLDRRPAPLPDGGTIQARRRGFYFKKDYTRERIIPAILNCSTS